MEDHQVGRSSCSDPTQPIQSGDPGRAGGKQRQKLLQTDAASLGLRPGGGQSGLQARDAAPGESEVPVSTMLLLHRRGGVVAHDGVDGPVQNAGPEAVLIRPVADRWAALELRCAVGDLVSSSTWVDAFNHAMDGARYVLSDILGGKHSKFHIRAA